MYENEFDFIKNKVLEDIKLNKDPLVIKGFAGSGKSTFVNQICYELTKNNISFQITALTNKALEAAYSQYKHSSTLHKFLKIRLTYNSKTGEQVYIASNMEEISPSVLFIDEYSMIDKHLFAYLLDYMEKNKNTKVIFVGDPYQLPPVSEGIDSKVWDTIKTFNLSIIKRSEEPFLQALYTEMSKCVQQKVKIELCGEITKDKVIEFKSKDWLYEYLDNHTIEELDNIVVLAYTNQETDSVSNYIRKNKNMEKYYSKGTLVINNDYIFQSKFIRNLLNNFSDTAKFNSFKIDQQLEISEGIPKTFIYNIKTPTGREKPLELDYIFYSLKESDNKYLAQGISPNWKLLYKYFKENKLWKNYYEFKESFGNLRLKCVSTIHKSQGSSYDTVIIQMTGMQHILDTDLYNRLLYVAFSRARRSIILVP